MTRILTPESNTFIMREYRGRLAAVSLLLLALAVALIPVFFIPSYQLLDSHERSYEDSATADRREEARKANEESLARLNATHELSQRVQPGRPNRLAAIDTLMANAGSVRLDSVELPDPSADATRIIVRGRSATRDGLLAFEARMRADRSFSNFKIPAESRAQQADIAFEVTFEYHEN